VVYFSEKEQMMLMYSKYSGRIGWNGFAGFNATLVCSILVLFGIINFDSEFKITRKVHFSTLTPILIGVIGNFFYGRTGLLVSFMMIFVYCFMVILKYSSVKLLMYFFAIFMLLFIIVVVLKNRIHALESIYNWVFEIFINYSEGNGLEASSLTTLKAMYILPNLKTFLLGDGYYTNAVTGFYYMNIDVGILRLLYFWGAIPTIILYIFSLKGFRNTFCDRYLFILPILLLVLFELKGEACRLLLCISVALQFYNKEIIHRNKGMRTRS
jgi:hypothetical protein